MPSLNVYRANNSASRIKTINAFRSNGNSSRIKTVNAIKPDGNGLCVYRDVPDYLFKTNDKCTDYTGDWGSWETCWVKNGQLSDWPGAGNKGTLTWDNGNMRLNHNVAGGWGGLITRTGWAIDMEPYSYIAIDAVLYAKWWGYTRQDWSDDLTYLDFHGGLLPLNFGLGTTPTALTYATGLENRWYNLDNNFAAKSVSITFDVRAITGNWHVFAGILRTVGAEYFADIYQIRSS